MSRLITYGDIHGCCSELAQLRQKIKPAKNDIEVCVGDVITRGKDSIKTLRYLQSHNIKSVLGNHEDKIVRYLQHQESIKENPIVLDEDEQDIVVNLNAEDISYLKNMPLFMRFEKITILHGGLQNRQNLNKISKKSRAQILRLRFLDQDHNFVTFGKEDEKSIFWADIYNGGQGFVVYGHQNFNEVKINQHALGIDTGCVYGGKLSAAIFQEIKDEKFSIESVNADVR
ncbi:serine/threonine protein phosphatase 1 [Bathymodiolus thermophilus thioautotrophic gill symbiont]|uniref:Serine/threonine protein phosphatase 1 n=2 Tax=Bathymodiolus thermophilus thioautotrophic gill symbiont TaxID=2360 RepID=A0A3G3IQ38_9GAMM|nr:metallophosphoesterase [Bathymodiolus thermophilus thioautotrophic gill symbiont]AYQ57809.1 serine/threonine protein phosphatase 1 [Bathymodiolus thermophilus thioautotrophic gill symbiont]